MLGPGLEMWRRGWVGGRGKVIALRLAFERVSHRRVFHVLTVQRV